MLQSAEATPELKHAVAEVDKGTLHKMQILLTPKGSVLRNTLLGTGFGGKPPKNHVNAIVTRGREEYIEYQDVSLSVAARLQAATCPAHVAAIMQSVPASDQVHRVKVWAKLKPQDIYGLSALSLRSRRCLEQVFIPMIGSMPHRC